MEKPRSTLLLFAPGREFVAPYVMQALPDWDVVQLTAQALADGSLPAADAAVMLSSTDVYDVPQGGCDNFDESAPVKADSELLALEKTFAGRCSAAGVRYTVFRCANTVGTGMTGLPMKLAGWVYRGWLMHFPGNEARISAVHASDVAACVAAFAGLPDSGSNGLIINLTDGDNPTIHDFLEALAYRMNQKRISVLGTRPQQWIAAVLYGNRRMRLLTTTVTFRGDRARELLGVNPVKVTEYLTTHVYDNSSL